MDEKKRSDFVAGRLAEECPVVAIELGEAIADRFPGSAILLYGSGISILKNADANDVLYDFYVIAPSYGKAYSSRFLAFLNVIIPPNVFYIETPSQVNPDVKLRAKYAVLSIDHFEKLVSKKTFHSYFWARFAQPCKLVRSPDILRPRILGAVLSAIDVFTAHAGACLSDPNASVHDIWHAGLSRSYKAELRAEAPERVQKLLENYEKWPSEITRPFVPSGNARLAHFFWRVRSIQGALLSVMRLLKGILTFENGVDYIAWKISRHAGFDLPVKDWERRWSLVGAPFLARRYYRMKKEHHVKNKV